MTHFGTRLIFISLLSVFVLTGCKDTGVSGQSTVPYVESMLSGETDGLQLVSSFNPHETRGSIALVGPYDSSLVARFLKVDELDNIDAKKSPDGLPDFAGEQVDVIEDAATAPYSTLFNDDVQGLRTAAARNFILSLDDRCSIGPFDAEKLNEKLPAKLLVFTSPYNAAAGSFDIDTLCRHTGSRIPVVFPAKTVMEHQIDRGIEHLHVLVLTDSLTAASGVYQQIFEEASRSRGVLGTGCVAISRDSLISLNSLLGKYKSAGGNMPLSALIIDDTSVSAEEVSASLNEVLSVQNEANLNSRKLITKDFVVVDMQQAVTEECYRILRKNNIFTHNIAYPMMKHYVTVKTSDGDGFSLVEKD